MPDQDHRPHAWGHHPEADWDPATAEKRRQMGRRFGCMFVSTILMFVLLVVGALLLAGRLLGMHVGNVETLLLVVCLIPLALFAVLLAAGIFIYQRVGSPVADMMAAADAIAAGDLTVRVRERSGGAVGRLARRFNHMTAELERAEQQRRNLTADVAHELRTPLHILQGNLEGVLDGVYEPTPAHIAATLDEAHTLTRLVNDLQLLSLAEAGQLVLHPQVTDTADLLADVAERFASQAAEQGVALNVAPIDPPLEIHVDRGRMEQVLSNLVANALRHTPPGGNVTLAAGAAPSTLTVADTGEGIAAEDLPYIFDRFWRGDRSRTRDGSTGSGLGLAIARQLVLAHGGDISAESAPSAGTTFTITLPGTDTATYARTGASPE